MKKPRDLEESPRSWPEDYSDENGQYIQTCLNCNRQFMGHKRRVVCRECVYPTRPPSVFSL